MEITKLENLNEYEIKLLKPTKEKEIQEAILDYLELKQVTYRLQKLYESITLTELDIEEVQINKEFLKEIRKERIEPKIEDQIEIIFNTTPEELEKEILQIFPNLLKRIESLDKKYNISKLLGYNN